MCACGVREPIAVIQIQGAKLRASTKNDLNACIRHKITALYIEALQGGAVLQCEERAIRYEWKIVELQMAQSLAALCDLSQSCIVDGARRNPQLVDLMW